MADRQGNSSVHTNSILMYLKQLVIARPNILILPLLLPYILPEPMLVCIAYCIETTRRAANELSKPEEVQRIIRQQEQAMDAEQRLDEAFSD